MSAGGTSPGWQVELDSELPGWLLVPSPDTANFDSWEQQALESLAALWQEPWADVPVADARAHLRAAWEARGESLVFFDVWPLPAALHAYVTVDIDTASMPTLDWWDEQGFDVRPYATDALGDGLLFHRRIEASLGRGDVTNVDTDAMDPDDVVEQLSEMGMAFEFGEATLFVYLQPINTPLLRWIVPLLYAMVESITVAGPDGEQKLAKHTSVGVQEGETWPEEVTGSGENNNG